MNRQSGLTLLELLVAFMIFLALVLTLVSLSTLVLDSWARGEIRKDSYETAEALLSVVEDDLQNVFVERQPLYIGREDNRRYLQGAHFVCLPDDNGRPVLMFVRNSNVEETREAPNAPGNRRHPADVYADLYEVVYRFSPDPKDTTLYRGVRHFDRDETETLFELKKKIDKDRFKPIEEDVLYLEFRFWDQTSNRWEGQGGGRGPRGRGGRRSPRGRAQGSAAGIYWDSSRGQIWDNYQRRTRITPPFYQKPGGRDLKNPDFVFPEMVQIHIVVRSKVFRDRRIFLTEPLQTSGKSLRVNSTEDLPDPPGFIRVGGEWIEYHDVGYSSIQIKKRGVRGTEKGTHRVQTEVLFGPDFTRVVYLPVRQEAVTR